MFGILLLLLTIILTCQGSLLDIQNHCCETGSNYAKTNGVCYHFTGVLQNMTLEDEMYCRMIVEICCMKEVHYNQCFKGKTDAEKTDICHVNVTSYGAEQYTQCCQCCRLGRGAAKTQIRCDLTEYGNPCDQLFEECCRAERARGKGRRNESDCFPNNPCEQICFAADNSVRCSCHKGYDINPDGKTCADINECRTERPCAQGTLCINTVGSFTCSFSVVCPDHAQYDSTTNSCICPVNTLHNATTNSCECKSGFAFNIVDGTCEDIDECIVQAHNCNSTHQCLNRLGTFECCGVGFSVNPDELQCKDINECAVLANACPEGMQCSNTEGSYSCRRILGCGTGYTLVEKTQQCEDINECTLGIHNCGTLKCRNVQGSFRCEMKRRPPVCPPGTLLNQLTKICESPRRHDCDRGLWQRNGICVDINECAQRVDTCDPQQTCHNTHGSYYCSNTIDCGPGLWYDVAATRCRDIDECSGANHTCRHNQLCRNTPGSFSCDCKTGYIRLVSGYCTDINECNTEHRYCSRNSLCINTIGSFNCQCKTGYEMLPNTRHCRDVNECLNSGQCEHFCENTPGSYRCTCRTGYKLNLDKRTCRDIDECNGIYKRCSYRCENLPGSFRCSCPSGFRMAADQVTCHDIDECSENPRICRNYDAICINTRGSHKCPVVQCPSSYKKSAYATPGNSVRCQRPTICPVQNIECLTSPLSLSYNFMTFPSKIKVPTTLFTISGRIMSSRYFRFVLKLKDASPQVSNVSPISVQYFHLNYTANSAAVELLRQIPGPQDIQLQLNMDMYSSDEHQLIGQAVSKLFLYVT